MNQNKIESCPINEDNMKILLEKSKEAIVLYDINRLKTIAFNSNACEYLNISSQDLEKLTLDHFIPIFQVTENDMSYVMNEGEIYRSTFPVKEDIKYKHFELNVFLLPYKNLNSVCFKWSNISSAEPFIEKEFKIRRLKNFLEVLDKLSDLEKSQTVNITNYCKLITPLISETLNVDRVSIRFYNDTKTELISFSMYDNRYKQSIEGIVLKKSEFPAFFEYIESQLLIKIDDIGKKDELKNMIHVFFSKDGMINALLASKIIINNDVKGYVFFQSRKSINWDSEYVLFANMVANQVASVLVNDHIKNHQKILETEVANRTQDLQVAILNAEEANKTKSMFVSNVSHEIRTPLTAIIGFLSLIDDNKLDLKTSSYIRNISEGAHNLLDLINDILDFSKIEAGKMTSQISIFNIKDLIIYLETFYKGIIIDKEIKLSVENHLVNHDFYTDGHFLRQILNNLLSNAIKFTHEGSICVDIRETIIDQTQSLITIRVSDTGIGIHLSDYGKLFKEFQQLDQKQRYYKGTGLGLSITKKLVELLNGTIDFDSQFGVGTTFSVNIPMIRAIQFSSQDESLIDSNKMINSLETYHILIVEDNPMNQLLLKDFLEPYCHRITTANDGLEAIECVSKESYDLIIMDLQMPIIDGITATRIIRCHPKFANIPIIAFSANQPHLDETLKSDFKFDDFMLKPITKKKLFDTIQKSIQNLTDKVIWNYSDSTNVLKAVASIVNVNTLQGVKYSGNDDELYLKLLKVFVKDHDKDLKNVFEEVTNNNIDSAKRTLHTLKGLLLMLGIDFLHLKILDIETALKEGYENTYLLQKLEKTLLEYEITCVKISYISDFFERRI